jgi:HD-GYP domain-containing protein (c-di-GMP phosphodiesterase class II)
MVKDGRSKTSKIIAIVFILVWLGIAVLGTMLLPGLSGEVREMFAFSQIIPILVGAFYFGQAGGLLVAFAGSLISGSLVILNISDVNSFFVRRIMFQIISFNSVALMTSFLSDQEKLHSQQVSQQLERITALRAIDKAINSGTELSSTLYILLESLSRLLDVEATAILLYDPRTKNLDLKASLGFLGHYPNQLSSSLKEGMAGQAAAELKTIFHKDYRQLSEDVASLVQGKGPVAYYAVPLVAHGDLKGVLEVYDRGSHPDDEWKNYLETLAGQAAIAIDQSYLLENLQHANAEMAHAYEETLRGWSRALDLRDKDTEGHTQRVVALSTALAELMGIQGERLLHFQRGAILHDIGKMGVPDEILLKPGPLNAEEWTVMRKHPIYAQMLLSPIKFLEDAIIIPYYHHERWDGSGYPLGLKGNQIPLEARIFAVADVWDALISDRPYRKALAEEEAIHYMNEQSGKSFDPEVIDVFMKMIKKVPQGNKESL